MRNPFKREAKGYKRERDRILRLMETMLPDDPSYQTYMNRLNEIDKILNRTSEINKAVIPALGGVSAVAGIYALQQFGGVIVPKAMDAIAARNEQKKHKESEDF